MREPKGPLTVAAGPSPVREGIGPELPPDAVPQEILDFLLGGGGRSLSIRGLPGTGKTSLALEVLLHLPGRRYFLSTRVDGLRLTKQYPFLAQDVPALEVMDLTSLRGERLLMKSDVQVLRSTVAGETASHGALDVAQFMTLPPPIQEVYSRAPAGAGNATIVIDSWEAMVADYASRVQGKFREALSEAELAETLLALYSTQGTNLILVRETAEPSAVDYLVDGVIEARREVFQHHIFRTIGLLKMRGIRVPSTEYPFTLDGGRFQYLGSPHRTERILRSVDRLRPSWEKLEDRFTWGHPQLSELMGPLAPGSVVFTESMGAAPDDALGRIVVHVGFSSGMRGAGLRVLIPEELSPMAALKTYPNPEAGFPENLRFIWSTRQVSLEAAERAGLPRRILMPIDIDRDQPKEPEFISLLLMGAEPTPMFVFAPLSTLSHLSGRDPKSVERTLRMLFQQNTERSGVLVISGVEGDAGSDFVARNCTHHLRLHERNGVKLLEHVHASGPFHVVLTPADPRRSPAFELIPMV